MNSDVVKPIILQGSYFNEYFNEYLKGGELLGLSFGANEVIEVLKLWL